MPEDNVPVLSVLLPAYNAQPYIEEAIQSILNQTYKDLELLIADDGSADQTRKIIDRLAELDPRIKTFHNTTNLGKTATVLNLYKQSRGLLITVHDADDISLPTRFEMQVRAFEMDTQLAVCGTSFYSVDEKGYILEKNRMPSSYEAIYDDILKGSQFHGPTMVIKRIILDDLGEIYRPYFKDNYEDTDLAARIIDKNRGYNIDNYLYVYRILKSSLCRKKVDVRNRNLYKVVSYLTQQRRKEGVDSLMTNDYEKVDQYLDDATCFYKDDPSRIHREAAAYFLYWKLYSAAIKESLKSVRKRPFEIVNIRTLLYVLRSQILNSFKNAKEHYTEML